MNRNTAAAIGIFALLCLPLLAQVPRLINDQGRAVAGSTNFDGNVTMTAQRSGVTSHIPQRKSVPKQPTAAAQFVFTNTGSLNTARSRHTATLLQNGKVLVAGGASVSSSTSAELYDPASGTWTATGSLNTARYQHTATLLPNGKVLVAGGRDASNHSIASAELYDPTSGTWTATGSLITTRDRHSATLLPNGKVLVAGGVNSAGNATTTAELYDPAAGTWAATGSLNSARHTQTATLLPNAKVLVAGGNDNINFLASAELYDPTSGTWSATGTLITARARHAATLLPNGKVLVAGGLDSGNNASVSAELYNPASGTWAATGNLNTARDFHTATLLSDGTVLAAGGLDSSNTAIASAELYDPTGGTWTATSSLNTAHARHTATLLQNGNVLIAGGLDSGGSDSASAELYGPASGIWIVTGSLNTARGLPTATLLPNGMVLVAGGVDPNNSNNLIASAELYNPASGTWTVTGSLNTARQSHTATLLPNGKVLVVGGSDPNVGNNPTTMASAELYDPASGTWTATGSLNSGRFSHTATLLPNGKVLIAGGTTPSAYVASAELYDPASGIWTVTGNLAVPRISHTATLLPNGKVLVAAGFNSCHTCSPQYLNQLELYDPTSGSWTAAGNLGTERGGHTATLLSNGKVLVAGGFNIINTPPSGGRLTQSELYDPANGSPTATGSLNTARLNHTATLLPNGKVLVAGGDSISGTSAELYNPASGSWSVTGSLNNAGSSTTATLLTNGMVLATGGNTAELYVTLPSLTSVVSRMTHGSITQPFDINLPFAGARAIECRSSNSLGAGNYTLVFTFANTLSTVGGASVTGGTGSVGSNNIDNNDTHNYIVNLTGVANAQYITVSLANMTDSAGNFGSAVSVQMGVLLGDTTANGFVNSADVSQTQSQSGQPVTGSNFREDVTANGFINSGDVSFVQSKSGTSLP